MIEEKEYTQSELNLAITKAIADMTTVLIRQQKEIAQKSSYVKKPYSWALYQTWKTVNAFEKERTEND